MTKLNTYVQGLITARIALAEVQASLPLDVEYEPAFEAMTKRMNDLIKEGQEEEIAERKRRGAAS